MTRKRALRRRIVVAILVLLSVALLTVYFRESSDGPVHRAEASAMHVVAPLQSGTARVIKPFRDGWNWVAGLFGAQSQNRSLRAEVQQLRAQLAQQLLQQQQNDRAAAACCRCATRACSRRARASPTRG